MDRLRLRVVLPQRDYPRIVVGADATLRACLETPSQACQGAIQPHVGGQIRAFPADSAARNTSRDEVSR